MNNAKHAFGVIVRGTRNIFLVLPIEHYNLFLQAQDIEYKKVLEHCIECRVKGKRGSISNTSLVLNNFLMAGDRVRFVYTSVSHGSIIEALPRKNSLLRQRRDMHHCIAVNIDVVLAVFSVQEPEFNAVFFDKMLCLCLLEKIPMIAVINKMDLFMDDMTNKASVSMPKIIQDRIDILSSHIPEVLYFAYTSTQHTTGVMQNPEYHPTKLIKHISGKIVTVLGRSGVGKSSLLNALHPQLQRSVSPLSIKYKEGKHTTTMPELCFCGGYAIIDTPGMRDMLPSQLPSSSVVLAYPEFNAHAQYCKLPSCSHRDEPECKVKEQLGNTILEHRYESYVKLRSEVAYHEKRERMLYARNKIYRHKK